MGRDSKNDSEGCGEFSSSERAQPSRGLGGDGILELGTICGYSIFWIDSFSPKHFVFFFFFRGLLDLQ